MVPEKGKDKLREKKLFATKVNMVIKKTCPSLKYILNALPISK